MGSNTRAKLTGLRRILALFTKTAPALYFKDNQAAFSYACEFTDCTLQSRSETVALIDDVTVCDGKPIFYIVRLPTDDGGRLVIADSAREAAIYSKGDLVSYWWSGSNDERGRPIGLVAKRLSPVLDAKRGWQIAEAAL